MATIYINWENKNILRSSEIEREIQENAEEDSSNGFLFEEFLKKDCNLSVFKAFWLTEEEKKDLCKKFEEYLYKEAEKRVLKKYEKIDLD